MQKIYHIKTSKSADYDSVAFYDKLTKLPNQNLLYDRLGQEMASSRRTSRYMALMFMSLNDCAPLNYNDYQKTGDLLVIEAASRIKNNVREVDTVARTSNDEFIVMLNELTREKTQSITQVHIIAEKIRTALVNPFPIIIKHDKAADTIAEYNCTVSIGVVVFTSKNENRDNILERAKNSMYMAKESRDSQICFSDIDT